MNKRFFLIVSCLALALGGGKASAQTYVKLNGLYALVGVVNPAVEVPLSDHFSFNAEAVLSPWESINGKPFKFAIGLVEGRWHPKEVYKGWYFAGSAGYQWFDMQKDDYKTGKGFGILVGVSAGYQWRIGTRWMIEAYGGLGFQNSWYTPTYLATGRKGRKNQSAEFLPYKVGVSFGYRLGRERR